MPDAIIKLTVLWSWSAFLQILHMGGSQTPFSGFSAFAHLMGVKVVSFCNLSFGSAHLCSVYRAKKLVMERYTVFPRTSLKKKLLHITLNSEIKNPVKQDPI